MTGGVWRLAAALLWLSAADAGAGTISVVHYDARVTVDIAAGSVAGTVVLTALGQGAAADSLQLDSGDLVVDAVTVQGRSVEFSAASHRVTSCPAALRPHAHACDCGEAGSFASVGCSDERRDIR